MLKDFMKFGFGRTEKEQPTGRSIDLQQWSDGTSVTGILKVSVAFNFVMGTARFKLIFFSCSVK